MPIEPKRLPFFDHVNELRRRLIIVAVSIAVASSVMYFFTDQILAFLLGPIIDLIPNGKLNVFGPFETFTFRFRISLYASLVVCSPIIIWQIMAFFLPALKPNERKWVVPTFLVAIVLFLVGNAFAYTVIMEPAFSWMFAQGGEMVNLVPSADRFLTGITLLLVGFGIAFELPVIVFYAIGFGLIPYRKLRANWRYVYVALFIVGAVATPDWSPVTMGMLVVSLVILYEASLLLARAVFAKRIREQDAAAQEAMVTV